MTQGRTMTNAEIDAIIIAAAEKVRRENPLPPAPRFTKDLTLRCVFPPQEEGTEDE
jgi:hypothetical protein